MLSKRRSSAFENFQNRRVLIPQDRRGCQKLLCFWGKFRGASRFLSEGVRVTGGLNHFFGGGCQIIFKKSRKKYISRPKPKKFVYDLVIFWRFFFKFGGGIPGKFFKRYEWLVDPTLPMCGYNQAHVWLLSRGSRLHQNRKWTIFYICHPFWRGGGSRLILKSIVGIPPLTKY